MLMWRIPSMSAEEPATTTSRFSAPREMVAEPTVSGAMTLDGAAAQQCLRIVQRDIARRLPGHQAGTDTCCFGTTGQHDDQIGAQRGELIDDIAARALRPMR